VASRRATPAAAKASAQVSPTPEASSNPQVSSTQARGAAGQPRPRRYWLMKSEPDVFSYDDLLNSPNQTTMWEGVRNYQARNMMRDEFAPGDGVLFYHSNIDRAIVGLARVTSHGYPDPKAFDEASEYFDPKSKPDNPTWYLVDVQAVAKLPTMLTLDWLRGVPELATMMVLRKGSRLSVQPVEPEEWATILELAGVHEP
jgi:predicted RNA-binding protein with PUA-like domain